MCAPEIEALLLSQFFLLTSQFFFPSLLPVFCSPLPVFLSPLPVFSSPLQWCFVKLCVVPPVKQAVGWHLSGRRWGKARVCGRRQGHSESAGSHARQSRVQAFSFQLVWHATDRCAGITATIVLTSYGNVPSGGNDWRPRRYLCNGSFLEMQEI